MALDLLLVAALIILNAGFAGTELALVSLREGQLRQLESQGDRGRRLARLARDPNRFLATLQVGITLAGFLASATAAVSLAEPLIEPLSFFGGAAEPVAIVLVTIVLAFFSLVIGELAPKRIALQRAERWAMLAARPLSAVAWLTRPVVWLLGRSTDVVVRLLGADPSVQREAVTAAELRDLVASQRGWTAQHRQIITGALDIAERSLRSVVVPRRDVVAIAAHTPAPDARALLRTSGHSRAPVIGRDLDDLVGVVHLRDLVDATGDAGEVAREALVLPESVTVLEGLKQLQGQRQSMAVVTNEFGGVEGIVTVEDLLEEVVGEIYDETDRDVAAVQRQADGSLILRGAFPMHDLVDLGVELPEGDYTTIAGFLLDRLGHIPEPGETVVADGIRLEVLSLDGRAIGRLRLSRR